MKVLLALDATNFAESQLDFPAYIANLANADITAIFLENMDQLNVPLSKYSSLEVFQNPYRAETKASKENIERNIESYKLASAQKGLSGNFTRSASLPEDDIIKTSRFYDLLLISDDLTLGNAFEEEPTKFAEEVLTHAQCAVMVMPKTLQSIEEVIFTGNGSFSSMYAIRQFTSLFPGLKDKPVTLLYVTESEDESTAHKKCIKAYLQHHYTHVSFKILTGNPSAAIFSHLSRQTNCVVTFGAYGRSKFSQFFKKSRAENVLNKLDMPVFITHP